MSAPAGHAKQQFLDTLKRENATTMKLLRAYPEDQAELKPHEKMKSARELAWVIAIGQMLAARAVREGLDWSKMGQGGPPPAPATISEVATGVESSLQKVLAAVEAASEEDLDQTIQFPSGPGKMGDVRKMDFLWFVLHDHIHHRGQLSVYLRMAEGKVPAIYGPTADEKWI